MTLWRSRGTSNHSRRAGLEVSHDPVEVMGYLHRGVLDGGAQAFAARAAALAAFLYSRTLASESASTTSAAER